ncbi:DUF445 family protein [Candidimonas sp. SYP-B2681]|uniref:DUF445 domain-containing protein n=1 Tax=Candidimonas sp. SYP-B2681 TaxID=2497686 RepID=UPI000F87853D|nr:DUF445 family protein [Candidimonas sp. SYP-B2681]RTZ38878.1 DUF445 family protein [Candidimonas sp. SYP-B2681]
MNKETELKRAKRTALCMLLGAAIVFVITIFSPRSFWMDGLKAISEAAMVGALADWFAVVALFRRVPIPFVSRHTAIIPRNKDKIAENLATFVKEKFLHPLSIVELIRKHDPAKAIAGWLTEPGNAERIAHHMATLIRTILDLTDDRRIQSFMKNAIDVIIDKVDLSSSVATVLDNLTKDGRHQELLDQGVGLIIKQLDTPATRLLISEQIVAWLKREHPIKEKVLPTEWLGENLSNQIASAVNMVLDDIVEDKGHKFRKGFDDVLERLIQQLKNDPNMASKAEEIKQYLKNDQALNTYVKELWDDLRDWLKRDLDRKGSVLHEKIAATGQWISQALGKDAELRASLNQHMERAAKTMAPDFSEFLTRHIRDTVKSWEAQDMSRQIELNIGKDLQFIRINGTLVGGLIGLILYFCSQIPHVLQLLAK